MVWQSKKGFTLIELLVVISIISLLSSVVLSTVSVARKKSRDTTRITQMREVAKAIDLYHAEYGNYPVAHSPRNNSCGTGGNSTEPHGEWDNVIQLLINGGFLPAIPRDPINSGHNTSQSYCYKYASYTSGSVEWRRCSTVNKSDADIRMEDYGYVLLFRTESSTFNLPQLATWNRYTYCLLGPLRS